MAFPRSIIIDGHEDISINALPEGRDYLTSAQAIRQVEADAGFENPNGTCMLGLDDWLRGGVAIIVATIATIPRSHANPGELSYPTIEGAHQQALAHLDFYRRWASTHRQIELVRYSAQFDAVLETWRESNAPVSSRRIGLILMMENADPIREPQEVAWWAEQGIVMVGPAWHDNRFTGDTKSGRPLTPLGRQLLSEMDHFGVALDLTHMSEAACLEALERFEGAVAATHAHSRRTVDLDRLLSDQVIEGIMARDGMIGVLPINWALDPEWERGRDKRCVTLAKVVDAIDHVCQIAGDASHVGIGSDFDGGQGSEAVPAELDTIADLPRLADALKSRGYSDVDVSNIMVGNWAHFLRRQIELVSIRAGRVPDLR